MSLYADISEANKYPSRNDLHKCVFNKDRNVSVCDRKWQNLFIQRNSPGILRPLRLNYNTASIAFVHLEKSPWNFAASQAQLQHSVNRFEFEVYSVLDGKRYVSILSIPDMHLFDHYPSAEQYPSQGNTRARAIPEPKKQYVKNEKNDQMPILYLLNYIELSYSEITFTY